MYGKIKTTKFQRHVLNIWLVNEFNAIIQTIDFFSPDISVA